MDDVPQVLLSWARNKSSVRRVWFFGSLAKGNASAESDLDVAIEIEPADNCDTALGVWISEAGNWRKELQPQVHVTLDLQWYDSLGSTPVVEAGLKDGGVLIYDRASAS